MGGWVEQVWCVVWGYVVWFLHSSHGYVAACGWVHVSAVPPCTETGGAVKAGLSDSAWVMQHDSCWVLGAQICNTPCPRQADCPRRSPKCQSTAYLERLRGGYTDNHTATAVGTCSATLINSRQRVAGTPCCCSAVLKPEVRHATRDSWIGIDADGKAGLAAAKNTPAVANSHWNTTWCHASCNCRGAKPTDGISSSS